MLIATLRYGAATYAQTDYGAVQMPAAMPAPMPAPMPAAPAPESLPCNGQGGYPKNPDITYTHGTCEPLVTYNRACDPTCCLPNWPSIDYLHYQ